MARKKQPRRKPGTGTVRYKKGRALPYETAFPIGHEQYRYDYFATGTEATAHLDRLVEERDSPSAPRNIQGGSQRVDDFLGVWLDGKRPYVREKTWLGYKYLCNLAVAEIGRYRIDEVARERAESMLAYFHRRGFKNVGQMRAVLRQAFQFAVDEEYVRRNPFQKAKVAPVEHRQAIALTKEQRARMLAVAADQDDGRLSLCPLWHLYSRLGLRRGEGIGLLWANIDWQNKAISITQQFTAVGGKVVKGEPKTKKSRRTVPLPDDLVAPLRALYAAQRKRAAADKDWIEQGLIFAGIHGGPMSLRYLGDRWKKLKSAAGIPEQVTTHDLRHTADYLLEQSHVPQSTRMSLLGHTTIAMDRHYTDHADLEAMRRAVEG